MTLIEMLVAMAILVIVMAAILPQLHCVQNSWAFNQSNTEMLQNGRVLIDHITANLSQATQVTAVSASSATNGFIEYLDNDGNTMRYDLKANGSVEFGRPGSLSELAGPATQLRFICYDINNIDLPITDPNRIRAVSVEAIVLDADNHLAARSFTSKVLIRANTLGSAIGPRFIFDTISKDPAVYPLDATHHLCAYEGAGSRGYAAVLNTDITTHAVTKLSSYEFDTATGKTPALAKIDSTHYLCAYEGPDGDGWAVILQINPSTLAISKGTPFEYDTTEGKQPTLSQIDSTHYLCVYCGHADDGYAVILTANTGAGTITKGTTFKFDDFKGACPSIARIDATHHLCVYKGKDDNGSATILVPNITSGAVSQSASFEFDSTHCEYPTLAQIDATHYLCTYAGHNSRGFAVIFTVGPAAIGKSASYEFDSQKNTVSSLIKIDNNRYLCAYQTNQSLGKAAILTANTLTGRIATESALKFDNSYCAATALSPADNLWFLCVYEGSGGKGYAVMLDTDLHVLP